MTIKLAIVEGYYRRIRNHSTIPVHTDLFREYLPRPSQKNVVS